MRNFARFAVLAAAIAASAAASAVSITFVSAGTFVGDLVGNTADYAESVVFQSHPGFGNLTSYVENYDFNALIQDTAVYSNGTDSFTIRVDDATFSSDPQDPNLYGTAAVWTYVSGTGSYANLTGHGTYTQNGNYTDHTSTTSIKGNLNPVPEPASIAALGLGAAAMLRRRKRA